MKNKLAWLTCVAACAMLLSAAPGHAAPALAAYDDFNDDSMNPAMWIASTSGVGPVAEERNGWVEVTLPADSHEAATPNSFGASFRSKQCLRGDFDIKVDYFLLDWPVGSGVRVGLSLVPDTKGHLGNVQRASFGKEVKKPSELYGVDYQNGGEAVPTTHMSGSLRMARSGSWITCGVLVEGVWVELYSADFGAENYYLAFAAWSHDYAFADQPVKIAFDNFAMLYGELVPRGSPAAVVQSASEPPKARPAVSAAPEAVARMAALRSSLVVRMPHGRSFFRMQQLPAKDLPGKCGPYKRLRFELPPGKANVK